MNTFALELFDDEGAMCCFYTVRWETAGKSETEKFFDHHAQISRFERPLQELATFMAVQIGAKHGAIASYFRFENYAHALPPSGLYRVESMDINYKDFPLRLYCLRISDSIVVLFNGAEKTAGSAQGGKTSMVFHEANQFARRLLEALRLGEIYIDSDGRTFRNNDGGLDIFI